MFLFCETLGQKQACFGNMIRQLYVSGYALHHSYIHGHFVRPKINKLKETTFKQVYVGFENLTSLRSIAFPEEMR